MKLRSILGVALVGLSLCESQAAIQAGDTLLIDFSRANGTDGQIMPNAGTMNTGAGNNTGIADSKGNYWNNAWYNSNSLSVAPPSVTNLITLNNVGTGVDLSFSKGWEANGFNNGGLKDPAYIDPDLLGEIAFVNATGDYFFHNAGNSGALGYATMTFSSLNPNLTYDFKIFGSRLATSGTDVRKTLFSITDANGTHSFELQTTGTGIGAAGYNGNNNTFAYLEGIVPDEFGTIELKVSVLQGGYAYINTLQLTAVPEPEMYGIAAAAGCLALIMTRRRRRA